MFPRLINPLKTNSFFLFGARGTGKTTFLKKFFAAEKVIWIDLLRAAEEQRYLSNPDILLQEAPRGTPWVIIDEVQKVPKLLDVAHLLIEERGVKLALTGSSARKLKHGSANLLAGRAFVYHMYPLTHLELGDRFNLQEVLRWGALPKLFSFSGQEERSLFLESYAQTYLKEEILAEQLVRKVVPFRKFLEIGAQTSGSILNFRKIAEDIGGDPKTVKKYFEILEDTLIGFFLPAFHRSLRKQQTAASKFYFYDIGVRRALEHQSFVKLNESSYEFGRSFEQFLICEVMRLNTYLRRNFAFSYLKTEGGAEVDLVIERPGQRTVMAEIKSSVLVQGRHLTNLKRLADDYPEFEAICLSREVRARKDGTVSIFPWQEGLASLGLGA